MDDIDLDQLIIEAVGPETNQQRWPWSAAQEAELRRWYGRVGRQTLAERVSAVLQREMGLPEATRTIVSCQVRAFQYAIPAYDGKVDEVCLKEAAREAAGFFHPYLLYDMAKRGLFPTRREGKKRYVSRTHLAHFLVNYREVLLAQEEALEATEGAVISKQEGMKRCGLKETHFARYLKTGVIRAWRVPLGLRSHGFWLVDRASVEALMAARAAGRLRAYLDERADYVALRHVITAEIRELRQQGKLGRRDPLTSPASKYHADCFKVAQVASHTGLTAEGVYREIRSNRLAARRLYSDGRWRYAVETPAAQAFAEHVAANPDRYHRYRLTQRRQIVAQGLLMVDDLAARWSRSPDTVRRYARQGLRGHRLPYRLWGQYLVFETADVAAFETATGLSGGAG